MAKVRLASVAEIPEGGMIERSHAGMQICLAKVDGRIYAIDNVCTHQGAPLHEGVLGGGPAGDPCLLTCPWHDAHFDLRTGKVLQDTPWAEDTQVYEVEVRDGEVWVELPAF